MALLGLHSTSAAAPSLTLRSLGPGNLARFDSATALQIDIDPTGLPSETYLLQWRLPTPDGDPLLIQRRIPLAEMPTTAWLYGMLPHHGQSLGQVQLRTLDDDQALASIELGSPAAAGPEASDTHLILVVGPSLAGLDHYQQGIGGPIWSVGPTTVKNMTAEDLPDRPEGLQAIDTIVWTGNTDGLDGARRNALRQWIDSGGHLIVSLPDSGDPWQLTQQTGPLADVMTIRGQTSEVSAPVWADLISSEPLLGVPGRQSIRTIEPTERSMWQSMLELPSGQPVAAARAVGLGRLTVVGIDVTSPSFDAMRTTQSTVPTAIPDAATFWNPLLGRRDDAPTAAFQMASGAAISSPIASRQMTVNDQMIAQQIASTTNAGGRLMLVMFLLVIYWLVAVPGVWMLTKNAGRRDFAWPGFLVVGLGAAGLTTLWSMSGQFEPPRISHLTVVDQVAGHPNQHVQSWMNLTMQGSSVHQVEVESDDDQRPTMYHWEAKGPSELGFASVRTLERAIDTPWLMPIQARDTSTGLRLDWTGVIDPLIWTGMLRIEQPISLTRGANDQPQLSGRVQSELSQPLEDVSVVLIEATHQPRRWPPPPWNGMTEAGFMPVRGAWWKLPESWAPGASLDLSTLVNTDGDMDLAAQIAAVSESLSIGIWSTADSTRVSERLLMRLLEMASLATLWPPPPWRGETDATESTHISMKRPFGIELDLGPHLASPVLLIMGVVKQTNLPVSVQVDGRDVQDTTGDVLLRWRVPLSDQPIITTFGP